MDIQNKNRLNFAAGLLCGLALMWVQLNYYGNDWSLVPHPNSEKMIIYAIEARTGNIKLISYSGDRIFSWGLSNGDKLDAGEKVKTQFPEEWTME